ncbi:MAG: citrate lyase subunit beta / citryl-CoA lyase [Solirubrobacteraceae bacterium]|nr:citrate lyase subunit beta / citryl-CoA lyase [Solirubrobacteraceae bacterium]
MNDPSPRRRACLSVPGSARRMIEKAAVSGADEIVIDLEDAVAVDAKESARATVLMALDELDWGATAVAVRVNAPGTPWCHADLAALAAGSRALGSIVVPKVESAGDLAFVDRLLDGAEAAAGRSAKLRVQALVETAAGLGRVQEIGQSSPRLDALILGYADLAASLGRSPAGAADRAAWNPAREAVLTAARAHGLQAIDGPSLTVAVDDVFTADTASARALGWDGRWAIHPRQVPALLAAFTPTAEELTWARRVVDALAKAAAEGARGAVAVDGQMIDEAVRRAAVRVLARAGEEVLA